MISNRAGIHNAENILRENVSCTGLNYTEFKDHGEEVLSIILKQHDTAGGIGIAPKANGYIISQWRPDGNFNTADAILAAISELEFGDIILLEAQVFEFPNMKVFGLLRFSRQFLKQSGWPLRWGITVIEAGGNGQELVSARAMIWTILR